MPPPPPCGRCSRPSPISTAGCGRSSPRAAPRGRRSRSTAGSWSSSSRARPPPSSPTPRSTGCARPTSTWRAPVPTTCRGRSPRSTATTCGRSTSRSPGCGSGRRGCRTSSSWSASACSSAAAPPAQPTGPGKIAEYGGRGDLRRWVRSVAVRTCLNELRKGRREVLVDDEQLIAQHAIATDDPEIEYMKRTYAHEFRAAFGEALGQLGSREQTLLALPPRRRPQHRRDRRDLPRSTGSPRSAGSRRPRSCWRARRSRSCAAGSSCRRASSTACCA